MPTGIQHGTASGARLADRSPNLLALIALVLAALGPLHRGAPAAAAMLAIGVAAATARTGPDSALRLAVFALALALSGAFELPFGIWIGVLVVAAGARRLPRLLPRAGWLPPGAMSRPAWWLAVVTVLVAGAALTIWAQATEEFGQSTEDLVDFARDMPVVVLVVGGLGFVLINAVAEELAYRGLALEAASECFPPVGAVLVQAGAFGAAHIAGFPAGAVGVGLAATYGAALGALRLLTGGMRAPILVHIAADATILVIFMTVLLPE